MGQRSVPNASRRAGPHIDIGEKRPVPIGVVGGEIGASRNMGATIVRRDGIIPPMIGADTRPTRAFEAKAGNFYPERAPQPVAEIRR